MGTRHSSYTRTERILLAVQRLVGEPGWISTTELVRLTNAPTSTCRIDLALLRDYIPLESVDSGPEVRWVMPGRAVVPRDEAAYLLACEGFEWGEVTVRAGFASQKMAKAAARRYATWEQRPWPPVKVEPEEGGGQSG